MVFFGPVLLFVAASLAQTIMLDGVRDTAYGSPLTLQTVETTYGDNKVTKFHFFSSLSLSTSLYLE
jgi:hypothetical protein